MLKQLFNSLGKYETLGAAENSFSKQRALFNKPQEMQSWAFLEDFWGTKGVPASSQ